MKKNDSTCPIRNDAQASVLPFLKKHGMLPDYEADTLPLLTRFTDEIDKRLGGGESSLAMLPTYLRTDGTLPENVPVLVLDAGGTNLRLALMYRLNGIWQIEQEENHPMPGSLCPLEKQEYLSEMVRLTKPYAEKVQHVGYCFSYSARITPEKDGCLDCFNKGISVRDSEGMVVCRELKAALQEAGCPVPAHWVLLNDSAATSFGAISQASDRCRDGVIGFVLGTGTNTCYSEKISRMKHCDLSSFPGEEMLINMECGGAAVFPMGDFDRMLHENDPQPGVHIYEKMVSGAYLGRLIWYAARTAAAEGLLSEPVLSGLDGRSPFTTREISEFLAGQSEPLPGLTESDRAVLRVMASELICRAAYFVAINLAGVALHRGFGRSASSPALVVAEGSTFWRCCGIKEGVRRFLDDFCSTKEGPYLEIISINRANLFGSAAAALLNA